MMILKKGILPETEQQCSNLPEEAILVVNETTFQNSNIIKMAVSIFSCSALPNSRLDSNHVLSIKFVHSIVLYFPAKNRLLSKRIFLFCSQHLSVSLDWFYRRTECFASAWKDEIEMWFSDFVFLYHFWIYCRKMKTLHRSFVRSFELKWFSNCLILIRCVFSISNETLKNI